MNSNRSGSVSGSGWPLEMMDSSSHSETISGMRMSKVVMSPKQWFLGVGISVREVS